MNKIEKFCLFNSELRVNNGNHSKSHQFHYLVFNRIYGTVCDIRIFEYIRI
jgi:hypothetical protein